MRRYRGVAVIVVVAVALVAWLLATHHSSTPTAAKATTTTFSPSPAAISWSQAQKQGTTKKIDWGPRCDTKTGHIAVPGTNTPECYAPFHGDNGGATASGVTATSVKVVAYRANGSDSLANAVSSLTSGTSDPAVSSKFQRGYLDIMSHYLELYGRHVDLVDFPGTGASGDSVAAVADAETIAKDIKPFAVIGGPSLTAAFADTLAANHVICISCAPGEPDSFYAKDAPYVWDVLKNPEQNGYMVNEYIGKRLAGRKAVFAGDPAMHTKTRVFGSIHLKLGADTESLNGILNTDLARYGVHYAVDEDYTDPTALAATARDLITRLKTAGVTTVVFTGDPLAPGTLTKVATEQDYFPEWVITGTALIDADVAPRLLYDQKQWAHAFGPANLFVPSDHPFNAADLWKWYYGTDSPEPGLAATGATAALQIIQLALQGMGPDVTPQRFGQVLFASPVQPGTPTLGQISFGSHGFFKHPDYTAIDDQAEVWWDPDAVSVDELGQSGKGSWRWVDGGKRINPGKWPRTAPKVFDPSNSVVTLHQPPVNMTFQPIHLIMADDTEPLAGSRPTGRREQHRIDRTRQFLGTALDIVTTEGFDALTMQRLADQCDSAIGAVYRYFPSKGALVAEVQREAIERISTSYALVRARSDQAISGLAERPRSLAQLVLMGRWFIALGETHPQELRLFQMLMSEWRHVVPVEEGFRVVPSVMRLLDEARGCIEAAADAGSLDERQDAMTRVVVWAAGVGGVMQAGRLDIYDAELFDGARLAGVLTSDLFAAWGATQGELAAASEIVDSLGLEV